MCLRHRWIPFDTRCWLCIDKRKLYHRGKIPWCFHDDATKANIQECVATVFLVYFIQFVCQEKSEKANIERKQSFVTSLSAIPWKGKNLFFNFKKNFVAIHSNCTMSNVIGWTVTTWWTYTWWNEWKKEITKGRRIGGRKGQKWNEKIEKKRR